MRAQQHRAFILGHDMSAPFIMRNDNDSPEAVSMKRLETHTQPAAESQQRSKSLDNMQTVSAVVEHGKQHTFEPLPEDEPRMLLQPGTRPISHEQLVVEVKGIYAGLVMVEAKCIDIDEGQSAAAQERDPPRRVDLNNDQWQSLISLHKQLLHEHHDFFLASQHPSASPALSRLAAKYSMPARMWRHGIHAFLEVLRHKLPDTVEHMLTFIYIAYSMISLLYESVSTFEDTWIECLGDLGRYRMAIEDDEHKDREVWSNVARFWYNKADDNCPNVGRLHHHLAILSRPNTLEQLSLYIKSLTCVTHFESAKESILTLFNPILKGMESGTPRSSLFETPFIKAHGNLLTKSPTDPSDKIFEAIAILELGVNDLLDNHITKTATRFKETWFFAAVANIAALFEYGTAKQDVLEPSLRLAFAAFGNASPGEKRCINHTKYFRVREYSSLFPKSVRRQRLFANFSPLVPLFFPFLPAVSGSPIGLNQADESSSIAFVLPLVAGTLYLGFAAATLAVAHSLTAKKSPIRVWVSMMSISAYGWWALKSDVIASPSLSLA